MELTMVVYPVGGATRSAPPACPSCGSRDARILGSGRVDRRIENESFWRDGLKHEHIYDETTESLECSNGHHWQDRFVPQCSCGWTVDTYIAALMEQEKT